MDILAHGLWTNAVFETAARVQKKERSKKDVWLSIFFGIAPDLFSFGIFSVVNVFTSGTIMPYAKARFHSEWGKEVATISANWLSGTPSVPDPNLIPPYVHMLYGITHSLIIFGLVFLIIWLMRKSPYWLFAGWGFHIFLDIFSHAEQFFPTPILFPFSSFHVSAVSWADPIFMLVNYSLLAVIYLWLYKFKRREAMRYTP